jgi:two-component system phosphate regulon sensor histidine kinase PhoR
MKSRLFLKVFGTYLLVGFISLSVVALLVRQEIRKSVTAGIEEELTAFAGIMELSSRKDVETRIQRLAELSRSRVTLMDAAGKILADSELPVAQMEKHFNRPEIEEARVRGKGRAIRFSRTVGMDMLYVALPLKGAGETGGYVRLARPLHEVKSQTDALFSSFLIAMVIVFPLALILAFFFSYRMTSPISAMEQFTERLRQGDVSGTLLIKTSDEMKQLADNINYLVEELQEKIRTANEEKAKLIAAFASMTEGVLVLDREDRIEIFNRAFRKMIASRFGDVVGKTLIEAFRNIELQEIFDRFKKEGEAVSREIALGEGHPLILDASISTIQGPPGERKTMIVFHDVTRLKRLERVRADFVANVTHEIRTPLTAILGFIETLLEGALEERETARKFLEIIKRHARRLNRLVEDLLIISDVELGEMQLFFESVSAGGILDNVLLVVEPKAREKELTLHREWPEDLPPIRADRDRLVQIFLNVLDNAVKFTPERGSIDVKASADGKGHVVISISDTGIGIPREELSRLGERFYRVDKTRSRELGGTGLGLSIVKHLMAAHGGKMEIESQLGKGTTVSLYFPVRGEGDPVS